MPIDDYLPFDPDSNTSDTQDDVDIIFSALGVSTWREVFFDIQDNPNPEYERGTRYNTAEEALFDMYDRGLMSFGYVVYYQMQDLYGIYIEYDEDDD